MMKIDVLYLVPQLMGKPGGIARYCSHICQALTEAGVTVRVIALVDDFSAAKELHSQFTGISFQLCSGSRSRFIQCVIQSILTERPRIIFAGHVNFAFLAYSFARIINAKLVTFIYGVDVFEPLSMLRRYALHQSNSVISISQFTAQQSIEVNGVTPDQIHILNNCLDPQFAELCQKKLCCNESRTQKLSLLTVARMSRAERYKGHEYVIRALPTLLQKFPNLVYDVVGGGDAQPELEELAKQYGVDQAICFHGVVSDAQLKQLYEQATVFIMPSRREGFGFVFLEAMAFGVPVIGGNQDATPEVILDGKTGYLVDPTSVEQIIVATSHLLSDSELHKSMSEAGLVHVLDRFSYRRFQ